MTETPFRPRLLDLFCGLGGASVGYHRAGFDLVGVDIDPQPDYPFTFHQADAMTFPLDGFDAVHASPPCELFSRAGRLRDAQGGRPSTVDLLTPTLARFATLPVPWIVENVPGAPLAGVTLCGSSFGLAVRRHRLFASSLLLLGLPCRHRAQGRPVGVYHVLGDEIPAGGRTAATIEDAQAAMGIDWSGSWRGIKQAIPPAYTEHLGAQLLRAVRIAA